MVVTPAFHDGKLVALFASHRARGRHRRHRADPEGAQVFYEGLFIPLIAAVHRRAR